MASSAQLNYYYQNKERLLKYRKQFYHENLEHCRERDRRYQEQRREYRRKTVIDSNKKITGVQKQPRPENNECRACGSTHRMLNYHHMDDNNTLVGIWICCYCHMRYHMHLKGKFKFEHAEKIDNILDSIQI